MHPSPSRQQPSAGVGVTAHLQDTSPLFNKTPGEIREMIYNQIFAYTRLSHGVREVAQVGIADFHPTLNALALLRTCRRIHHEIGDRWLRQVLFNFEDPGTMLEKLGVLSDCLISQVRHVRVRGDVIPVVWPTGDEDAECYLFDGLKLLPGLKLDTLTVLYDIFENEVAYDTLNRLIGVSDGWKELRFVASRSTLLGYDDTSFTAPGEIDMFLRKPQPANWQSILERREGTGSHPSMVIYRSKIPRGKSLSKAGLMADSSNWEPFSQEDTMGDGSYGHTVDTTIMATDAEHSKQILVIARRGKGVDYEEKRNSPYIDDDIRWQAPGLGWKEIRKVQKQTRKLEIDCFKVLYPDDFPTILDSYKCVDEYEWARLVRGPYA